MNNPPVRPPLQTSATPRRQVKATERNREMTLVTAEDSPRQQPAQTRDVHAFLDGVREFFRLTEAAEAQTRAEALEDLRFRAGEQWPAHLKGDRDRDRRPALTVNRIPQFVRQVTNQQRQNRPGIQVSPVGSGADVETAEILQGLSRHIENASDAEAVYDQAFDFAATCGMAGWIRVLTDYEADDSFDQEICITGVANNFAVYCDPHATKADRSDMRKLLIVTDLSREDYRQQYPDSELAGLTEFASLGDRAPGGWMDADTIRIAEYYWIEPRRRQLVKAWTTDNPGGRNCFADEMPDGAKVMLDEHGREIRREVTVQQVKWCKLNAIEILEERDIPGKFIPMIPVLGEELNIDGVRHLIGIVRFLRDPQRMYNFWASNEAETIALAPRAPYVVAEGQMEGHEAQWLQANTRNFPYLEYKPKTLGGQLAPPPQRNVIEAPIVAITQARMHAADDMKAVSGIYDDALGAGSNEKSGKAILARQNESHLANFNFIDNLSRAIRQVGRVILGMVPFVYDTPRVLRIVDPDGEERSVPVNGATLTADVERIFDLTTGRYDVTASAGPGIESRRKEAVESMMQLTQSYPAFAQFCGDLMVRNMDWPGAEEIAERLKKMLPPNLQDDAKKGAQLPPQVQAQMQAMGQQHDALIQRVHELTDTINTKKLELESRERIAALQTQAQLVMTEAKLQAADGIEMLRQEIAAIGQRMALLHEAEPIGEEPQDSPQQQQQQQQQQQPQQQQLPQAA